MRGRRAYALVVATAAVPRLAVLLHERETITTAFVDKGDRFARTFVASGTYGFIPGIPSAYTQPLYGFFLVPLYWLAGRSWPVVGLAQIAVAAGTAVLVYEIARRFVSARAAFPAALAATLEPYVVWHDVHMNREILDQFLAAAVVLLTLEAARRSSLLLCAALGAATGVTILGNVRLVLVPLIAGGFVLAMRGRAALAGSAVVLAAAALVVTPWVVRNRLDVGCATLTTDGRALWKANNPATLSTLRHGKWIDDVPAIPGAPPTPQDAGATYYESGRVVRTDECAQMHFYRRRALRFMHDHPGEKATLAAVGARMLWQPSVTATEGRPNQGGLVDVARKWVESSYMAVLYGFGAVGLAFLSRPLALLALALLVNDTLTAMLFVGETRYRIPWDFLIAIAASVALVRAASGVAATRRSRGRRARTTSS